MSDSIGIYVHIPFCKQKCLYCDFTSFPHREEVFSRYAQALLKEAEERIPLHTKVDTVFFGGGTPSVLPVEMLCHLLSFLLKRVSLAQGAEITLEMNPGTVTYDDLRILAKAGFNRASFGVQSFSDPLLQKLGRIHNAREAEECVYQAQRAGFTNCNIDLMYGLPDQTPALWEETLCKAIALPVQHLSCYSLIVEEGTPFFAMKEKGILSLPGEEEMEAMEGLTKTILARHGFHRYEVSNYALCGFESRHNLRYWLRRPYLGLGVSAHSFDGKVRLANTNDLSLYIENVEKGQACGNTKEMLSLQDAWFEELMLGFRLTKGVKLSDGAFSHYQKALQSLQKQGFLCLTGQSVALEERGMDVMNTILTKLMDV